MTNRITLVLFMFASSIIGCAPKEVAPTGPRAATSPEQVTFYQERPKRFEDLGAVEVPIGGKIRMDDRGDATAGFLELQKKAAALGANGLLFDTKKVQSDALVTCAYKGTYYQVPVNHNPKVARGHAIWVHEK
jgi:hypothetical protein